MLRLLIVDDEAETREGILERIPWEELKIGQVEEADNGIAALRKVSSFEPDIVLTDVRMPRMDGVEMSIKLRELFPECKIIFMSGYSDKEYLKSAIRLHAVNYVEKPINLKELRQAIQTAATMCLEEQNKKKAEMKINDLLKNSIPLLRSELAIQLTRKKTDPSSIAAQLEKAGLDIPPQSMFATILLKLDTATISPEQVITVKEEISVCLENCFKLFNLDGFSAFKEEGYFIIHLFCKTSDSHLFTREKLQKFCSGLLGELGNKANIFISVGANVKGLENVFESYETSAITIQKAFFRGYGCTAFYSENSEPPYNFSPGLIDDFLALVTGEKKEDSILFIKRLISDFKRCENTLVNNIKNFFYTMITEMEKKAKQKGFSIMPENFRENTLWEQIQKIAVITELEDYVKYMVEAYFHGLKKANEKNDPILMVIKYIHNNYSHTDLSISSISGYTHLAPTYICSQFKIKTGKTINQYITEFRLEKARELLAGAELKISDIALMIGLSDGGYFTKLFRKYTGLTPSEYRERNLL